MTTTQQNVPVLRFKDEQGNNYPNWREKKFDDIYKFKVTNSLSRDQLNYIDGSVRNIHYGDIHTKFKARFELYKEVVPYINSDINLRGISEDFYCQEGDLVIADASEDYSDIGKAIELLNLNGELVLAGLHTLLARLNSNNIHIGFGGYMMACQNVKQQIMRIAQGTKVLGISIGRMNKIELHIPYKDEQQKIATFLSSVDTKIEQLNNKKALWEQYKKGMMQKLFSQEIRFKDEQGNEYPGWEEKRLGEVAKFYSGGTPTTTKRQYYTGTIPFIKSGEINFSNTEQFISEEGLNSSSAKAVEEGDILYALYGATSGEVAISKINGAINQAVLCIKSHLCHFFIYSYLTFKKGAIVSTFIQGGQGNLSASIVKSLKINFPSIEEQQKIATFLSAIDQKIELVTTELKQARTFKKGLLQQMFI